MKRSILGVVVLLTVLQLPASAAGTATWPSSPTTPGNGLRAYTVVCVSNGSGVVSGQAHAIRAGAIVQVRITPGTSGAQPTDLFDLQLLDQSGLDILAGAGTNLTNAAPTVLPEIDLWADTATPTLDVVIAGAGSGKTVTVTILVRLP